MKHENVPSLSRQYLRIFKVFTLCAFIFFWIFKKIFHFEIILLTGKLPKQHKEFSSISFTKLSLMLIPYINMT